MQSPHGHTAKQEDDESQPVSIGKWAIATLAFGNFWVGIGAFLVVGISVPITTELGVPLSESALLLGVYAAAYAVTSPILVALTGHQTRRNALSIAMIVFTLGITISALSSEWWILLFGRALSGIGAGIFTPAAASTTYACVAPGKRGRYLSLVFFGIVLSQAIGLPAGIYMTSIVGWHWTFGTIALASAANLFLLRWLIPHKIFVVPNTIRELANTLQDWRTMIGVVLVSAHAITFSIVYTYLVPLIETSAPINTGLMLLIFGAVSALSGVLSGPLADRIGARTVLIFLVAFQMVTIPFFSFVPLSPGIVLALMIIWPISVAGFMIPQQMVLASRSQNRQSIVLSLNQTFNYVGVAIGSVIGGAVVARYGVTWLGFAGGLSGLFALSVLITSELVNRGKPSRDPKT